ncbi:hypothetical protein [Pseudomonas mohnii]
MNLDRQTVWNQSNQLFSVGYAMQAIGNILGADGLDYELDDKLTNGLHHAILAMGALVLQVSGDMSEASDPAQVGGVK